MAPSAVSKKEAAAPTVTGFPATVLHWLGFLSGLGLAIAGVASPSLKAPLQVAFTAAGSAVMVGVVLAVAVHALAHAILHRH